MDEDLELEFSGRYVYVQVKTRSDPIQFSDISSALTRFDHYRGLHVPGGRTGEPEFVLAVNRDAGPVLATRIAAAEFAQDVRFLKPNHPLQGLPPVWADSEEAFNWCVTEAERLPFVMVAPDVLVQHLAGAMMRMAGGLGEFKRHEITAATAAQMLQQFVHQVHDFPSPPLNYRPQDNEPAFITDDTIRLIVGFSGAGKTSWAAQAALMNVRPCAYFNIGDVPTSFIIRSLARELAAHWLGDTPAVRQAVANGAVSAEEALRLVASNLAGRQNTFTIVIDNAHKLRAEDAQTIGSVAGNLKLIFLAQPTAELDLLSAALDVEHETLLGWSGDSIGYEAFAQNCVVSLATANRIRALTAGLPLYVRSAIAVAKQEYHSDLDAFCDAFEGQALSVHTRQHTLLAGVFNGLDIPSKQVLACASLSDVPLTAEEIANVAVAFSLDQLAVVRKLRALRASGLLQAYGSQRSKVHDAIRPISTEYLLEDAESGRRAKSLLRDLIEISLGNDDGKERFPLFVKLLIDLQEVASLADFGSQEAFHEGAGFPQMWPLLESAATDTELEAEVRFECLDAVLYHRQRHGPKEAVGPLLIQMERLFDEGLNNARSRLVFMQKSLDYFASIRDVVRVEELIDDANALLPDNASYRRVFAYNAAVAYWKISKPSNAEKLLTPLVKEYVSILAINTVELMSNPETYLRRIRADQEYADNCKHLADCFDLLARINEELQRPTTGERKIAVRLFEITGSWDSAARVGIDLIYQYLGRGELPQALALAGDSLPRLATVHNVVHHIIPLRYLHAFILGRMGRTSEAREILKTADPFFSSMSIGEQQEAKRLTDQFR
ncbi:hypothetical protein IGS59_27535 [Janthinobacterium sp. GW460P]|uniref:ATP-binding protein n=1 Tax=unclassified Janthinobacterium TaxID=2610881 RepID=UPI00111C3B32|nr:MULTISPECIES: ATP-binding protein [unclassified Janthinobacterium]MCC7706004.1 hypothetical protein [Janthinobacterium sp. GW460P]MCC7711506.1 hypothetical protein [Janthinobacterium sp. GW460W]